jgi:ribonuclease HII
MSSRNILRFYQDNPGLSLSLDAVKAMYAQHNTMSGWIEKETTRLLQMYSREKALIESGIKSVAGVDEVGRGPMAGPVVACAVIFKGFCFLPGLNDSKKLTENEREQISEAVKSKASAFSLGIVDSEEIDRYNIHNASLLAMERAVEGLSVKPAYLLVDGKFRVDTLPVEQEPWIGGDASVFSIAAASIVAKVYRDNMMKELDSVYPGYGLDVHKGYCTAAHMKALEKLGVSPVHRKSYRPVKEIMARGKKLLSEQMKVDLD